MEYFKIGRGNSKPTLYQKSEHNIWTDSHVQQQMLKEHLDFSSDGASRKKESIQKITDFIEENTSPGSTLLDLGCGPGLYTSILKDKGYKVTGIDINRSSIEYALKQRDDIKYITGDYIKEYPGGKFNTVIMIYCDMGTHSETERNTLLQVIYHSLSKGGQLIFDVFTTRLVLDKREEKSWDYAPTGGFWSEKEYLVLKQTFHYPADHVFAYQYNLLTADGNKNFIVWERYFIEEEIIHILKEVGFRNVKIHKNILDGNNFTSDSEIFVVATK